MPGSEDTPANYKQIPYALTEITALLAYAPTCVCTVFQSIYLEFWKTIRTARVMESLTVESCRKHSSNYREREFTPFRSISKQWLAVLALFGEVGYPYDKGRVEEFIENLEPSNYNSITTSMSILRQIVDNTVILCADALTPREKMTMFEIINVSESLSESFRFAIQPLRLISDHEKRVRLYARKAFVTSDFLRLRTLLGELSQASE